MAQCNPVQAELLRRALPEIPCSGNGWAADRKTLQSILGENLYGTIDERFKNVSVSAEPDPEKPIDSLHHYGGKVQTRLYNLTLKFDDGFSHVIPFVLHLPLAVEKPPVVLYMAFRRGYPDRYLPVEEITDRGYALLQFCYLDATPDTVFGDFSGGLAGHMLPSPRRESDSGNVGLWAFAASRIMDWLVTCPDVDASCVSIAGHSRLGKTALWCSANDDRFFCAYCNDGGYGGSGLIRGKVGEDIDDFLRVGSWTFFCEKFKTKRPAHELPFDMHFVIAASAPRYVFVASSEMDKCMDYTSDYISCVAASKAWERLGYVGMAETDSMPVPSVSAFNKGRIGYYVRKGTHAHTREDWNHFLDFLDLKRAEKR